MHPSDFRLAHILAGGTGKVCSRIVLMQFPRLVVPGLQACNTFYVGHGECVHQVCLDVVLNCLLQIGAFFIVVEIPVVVDGPFECRPKVSPLQVVSTKLGDLDGGKSSRLCRRGWSISRHAGVCSSRAACYCHYSWQSAYQLAQLVRDIPAQVLQYLVTSDQPSELISDLGEQLSLSEQVISELLRVAAAVHLEG